MRAALTALGLVLALPVLGVLVAWARFDAAALATLSHLWQTVLPEQALQSFLLAAGVGIGVALLGGAAAAAVTLFQFPGRR
ncbi:MAG TPA: iron ABC transporter permease, partial [Burkholderiaceae bacterium]